MALYSRADYERDMETADYASSLVNRLILANTITGIEALEWDKVIAMCRRKYWNKLQGTRLALQGKHGKAPKTGDAPAKWSTVDAATAQAAQAAGKVIQRTWTGKETVIRVRED